MQHPTKFEIKGLFGNRDVTIPITSDSLILVGPNGIGKSTVTNIFYFFISRQWSRLAEYKFSEVALWFGATEIRAVRDDITGLSQVDKLMSTGNPDSLITLRLQKLRDAGLLERFLASRRLSPEARQRFASELDVTPRDIQQLLFAVRRRIESSGDEGLFSVARTNVERQLAKQIPNRTLFLPTYRRIEKDIEEIIPDFEERLRPSIRLGSLNNFTRSAKHYIDLVSFGMEDVKSNIEAKSRSLRDY